MKRKQFLSNSKRHNGNVIIFIGEKPGKNRIQINGKPGFFDAVQLAEPQSPTIVNAPYQFISSSHFLKETYQFYDPHLSKTVQFVFNGHSLKLIENDQNLTKEEVYHVFKHFLVKKRKRVFFLTEAPKEKIQHKQKNWIMSQSEMKEL
jgi:hypothetical protein